jgi:hypothetical protein
VEGIMSNLIFSWFYGRHNLSWVIASSFLAAMLDLIGDAFAEGPGLRNVTK